MLLAQLSDLHLLPSSAPGSERNRERFAACLAALRSFNRKPDLYIVTGDIADAGQVESYRAYLRLMADLDRPWLCLMGNHDDPTNFAAALQDAPCGNYQGTGSYRFGAWRVLCIDTSAPPFQGGFFDQQRADDLTASLAADPHVPTLIAMHHPPVATGVEWIDSPEDAGWIDRFAAAIAPFDNVRHIICGHGHMAVMAQFHRVPVTIAPATAPQLWPETAPFDNGRPDDRVMVYDGQPGFALHCLGKDSVRSTFATPLIGQVWLRHDKRLQEGVAA